ncbi:MAG: DsbA family protein [Rhodospirillaceae bacterium]|jgi:protein-disulfide isomerase|nr:DsbA family protein [Rhodospirillaceae bacterium]
MFSFQILFISLITLFFSTQPLFASPEDQQQLTVKQQEAVKKIVHDYIMNNPSIITGAIEALRQKEKLAVEIRASKALFERKSEIFDDPKSPVLGNTNGDLTIVEFFDYRCSYCKDMLDVIMNTVKTDGKIRLVMKELPILGPNSIMISRAALAAHNQNKYEEFHITFMRLKGSITDKTMLRIANSIGINDKKLKKDMNNDRIDTLLKNNLQLANALNIDGTPIFIIGNKIIPGTISLQALKQIIDQARKSK